MKKHSVIHGSSGFTLLELILSLTILGVVLLIIFGALRVGTRAWEKGEKDTAIQQRQRAVLSLLSQQIASACVYEIKMGKDVFFFRGSEDEMEFVSRAPIVPGALTGMVFVKYEILDDDEKGKKQLKLYERDAGFLKEEDLETMEDKDLFTLFSGIETLHFEYLKGDDDGDEGTWQPSWQPSEEKGMPLAVRLLFKQGEKNAAINLVVPIPCQKD